jgi:hypothetical protein
VERRVHHQGTDAVIDASDGRDVADEIKIESVVKRYIPGVICTNQEERIAVGSRLHHGLGTNIPTGAGPIFDDEGLAEPLREPLGE